MMNANLSNIRKAILDGSGILFVCSLLYLVWWSLAFKPVNPIRGLKTGWLLIPATISGIVAVYLIVKAFMRVGSTVEIIPSKWIIIGGIAAYILLAIIAVGILKRPITTELILIVG